MRRILIILLFLGIISCSHENKNALPEEKIINEVIVNVIDSIPYILKNYKKKTPFCTKVFPYVLEPNKVFKIPPPPGSYGFLDLKQFLNSEENFDSIKRPIFSSADIDYFLFQINNQKVKQIDESYFTRFYLMDYSKILRDTIDHFKVNIPLFSKDFCFSYVELEHLFRGGWKEAYIFKRKNKKWILYKKWTIGYS